MNRRFVLGLALLAVAAVVFWLGPQIIARTRPPEVVTLVGIGGGSKAGLLSDPEVQQILREKHGIEVDYTTSGSLGLPDCPNCDFLWPGNEADVERAKKKFGQVSWQGVYWSPLVLYSWSEVIDVLVKNGLAEQRGDTYFLKDMGALLEMSLDGKTWAELRLAKVHGQVAIITADPTSADSGNVFAAYMAAMLGGGALPTGASIETHLPAIREYIDKLGFLQKRTSDLWKNYVSKGMGAYPLIVAYESLGIELIQNEPNPGHLLERIRMIYPEPTVLFSHPIIALSEDGKLLAQALADPEIQKIAWERHGLRSLVVGPGADPNDPGVIVFPGVAEEILSVMPLPAPEVLDRIVEYLKQPPVAAATSLPSPPPSAQATPTP
jgi:hypothetical protein